MIGIKSNGIYIYHFNVSLLLLLIFFLYVMDCTAFGTSAYLLKAVHFVTFFTLLPICLVLSRFLDLTAAFASSSCGIFTGVASFVSLCLALSICSKTSRFFSSCKLLMTAVWALCASTLFTQINTHSFSMIIFSLLPVSSLMISVCISQTFSPFKNCSFYCLSTFYSCIPWLLFYACPSILLYFHYVV